MEDFIHSFIFGHAPNAIMAIAPLVLAAIMAAAGAAKAMTVDKAREDRQRKLATETARYSPWTGMTPGQIQEADPFGSALQMGATGFGMGQGMQNQAWMSNTPTEASPWTRYDLQGIGPVASGGAYSSALGNYQRRPY